MLKAVIFDMDGVIIDSEPMHAKAAVIALQRYGVNVDQDYLQKFIGSTTYYMCEKMVQDFALKITPQELFEVNNDMKKLLLKEEGHTIIPYIINLMEDLFRNGISLTIASSSPPEAIEEVMKTLRIEHLFHGYVSGMMVDNPKPAPDIFLAAAKHLGVEPEECIVIEDSFHGVSAAVAAGMPCIGFVNPNSGNQDLRKATILVEGFDEVDYEFVNQVYQYSNLEPQTILTTEHFIVKELSVTDIEDLYQIYQQPEIKKFLDGIDDLESEKEKHKAYIRNIYHFYGYGQWGVFYKENGILVGRCGIELKLLDGESIHEIGYLLSKDYQGCGYAKEFVTEIIKYCFLELDIRRIVAVIDKNNARSIHLAEQVGMCRIGECFRNNRECIKFLITYHS